MAAYGVYLWGPTIVAMVLSVPVPQAAKYFVFVTLGGVTGKIIVTLLAPPTGRRWLSGMGARRCRRPRGRRLLQPCHR
jgi:hypothetical protein